MIRPPSNQRQYDTYYTGDPAFEQPPMVSPTASEQEVAAFTEYQRKVKLARETGNWSVLHIEGATPTKFVMLPLPGSLYRKLADLTVAGKIGGAELNALAFRGAIFHVENLGDAKVVRKQSEGLGVIALVDIADFLDSIDKGIVTELGADVLRRAQEAVPLS